jgi:late competence protein required for DNA uptake (superfamily II DNA/RNA helicase)
MCADYSFIAIAFSCQAENCCHPVSENNKLFICTNCISTLYAIPDRLTIGSLYHCTFCLARAGRTDISVSSYKKKKVIIKKKEKPIGPSYLKDTGDISSLSYDLCLSPRLSIQC